jgi:hypothetical protein
VQWLPATANGSFRQRHPSQIGQKQPYVSLNPSPESNHCGEKRSN